MRLLCLLLFFSLGCGAPMVYESKETAPKKPQPTKPKLDYKNLGNPVQLNQELDIKGVEPVWVEGSEFLLEIRATKWDEIAGEREGRATLLCRNAGQEKTITIEEDRSKVVFGYTVSVSYAYEFYDNVDATYIPHVKLIISR